MPVFYHLDQEPTVAGHPQDNSWTQQGHGYSQGAPGYGPVYDQQPGAYEPGQGYEPQPGSYEPQPGAYEQGQVYEQTQVYAQQPGYNQPTVYDQQATVYEQQPAVYDPAGQQAHYDPAGQQPQQAYPGQSQPGLPQGQAQGQAQGQPRPGWEQWQLPKDQASRPAKPARGEAGFVASLFDFGFTSFVTPKIIKALYVLVTAWTLLWAVLLFFIGLHNFHVAGALFVLIVIDPILVLVSLGVLRVVLEFFMVTFRMQEDLRVLRERGAGAAAKTGDAVDTVTGDVSPQDGV